MNIEEGVYRLRAVWVNAEGKVRVHYDRQLCEDYNDVRKWYDETRKMIAGYGGMISSFTIEPYKD